MQDGHLGLVEVAQVSMMVNEETYSEGKFQLQLQPGSQTIRPR